MALTRRYGGLSAIAISAWMLHCGNSSFGSGDDAGGSDATSDGTTSDVANGSDSATTDAGQIDSAFVFDDPCSSGTGHTLCCDFDDDSGIAGCLPSEQQMLGSLSIASNLSSSPPSSLHSVATGDAGYAYGRHTLTALAETTCTFDLYIDKLNGSGHNIFAISVNGNDSQGIVSVLDPEADGGAAMLRLFGPTDSGPAFATGKLDLPFRQWVRVQMDLSISASGGAIGSAASLSFDGGAPVQITTNIASASSFGLMVGFDFVGTGNGDAYIDNLACDAH